MQIHPSGHAGYYPGTAKMQLKVLFEPVTGKLLGAGIVGFDGVDKRLDVLATALRGGMTVHELEGLELAYAPPFGSAKDPINMAGFVASNELKKDLRLWYPSEYPAAPRAQGSSMSGARRSTRSGTCPELRTSRCRPCARPSTAGTRAGRSGCTAPSGSAATWPTGRWCSAGSPT